MSQSNTPAPDGLQFETVEPVAAAAGPGGRQACAACRRPIADAYYAVGSNVLCPDCRDRVMAPPPGRAVGRFARATLLGLGAGLLGAAGWYAIRRFTGYEIGLVAVVLGVMVGNAVRKGSGGRGGRPYQLLAVALTYCCICANYLPDVVAISLAAANHHAASATTAPGPSWLTELPTQIRPIAAVALLAVQLVPFTLKVPVMGGAENILGLLIIGIAMWQAWKMTASRVPRITGPYRAGSVPAVRVLPPALPGDVL